MAVLIEGFSAIVRREAIERKYPGGWEAFAREVPNQTLCADNHLARVGFMDSGDMRAYIDFLGRRGLVHLREGKAVDVTIVSQRCEVATKCGWIGLRVRMVGSEGGKILICMFSDKALRAAGLEPDPRTEPVATPKGWTYEQSLSRNFGFTPGSHLKDRLRFLGTMSGMDVYEDLVTGKTVYVGRTGRTPGWPKHHSS